MEHFCTLFDQRYLLQGLALHASLRRHAPGSMLWIVCMDAPVQDALERLALPGVTTLPLSEIEDERLRRVKADRTPREYCWTVTPFVPEAVFRRAPDATRVTYLDADLYFFDSPAMFLRELDESGKHLLITEHAYAPEYDQTRTSGRFCVQFLSVRNTSRARAVMKWWQDRCIEWCYARQEDGKFGDQMYLDEWPVRFGQDVQVLEQSDRTLAPWNVRHAAQRGALRPVFYHFHAFWWVAGRTVRLHTNYEVGSAAEPLYRAYVSELREARRRLVGMGERIREAPASLPRRLAALALPFFDGYARV